MIERLAKSPLIAALVVLLAGLAGAGATLLWQGRAPALGEQAKLERVVHDYILDHPEILPQAMRRLEDRRNGATIAASHADIYSPIGSAWAGNPKGDVTIVEYFDYNCGFCRASLPTIDALLKADPGVKIVYRELPVLSDASKVAARYSIVAARAGKFAAFHQAMYAGGPISQQSIDAAVAAAKLPPAQVKAALDDPSLDAEIDRNYAIAKQLGMTGTPSWVIGDHVTSSALPLDELKQQIADARAKARG
ncbi:DsbA family protein [Sphingomonas sp. GlSt437]|uniref:DsbA family protein n=1 Tax=Sphingomonas sp. GlSt437 TaxID=3389970 RepID=UPI003A87488D